MLFVTTPNASEMDDLATLFKIVFEKCKCYYFVRPIVCRLNYASDDCLFFYKHHPMFYIKNRFASAIIYSSLVLSLFIHR